MLWAKQCCSQVQLLSKPSSRVIVRQTGSRDTLGQAAVQAGECTPLSLYPPSPYCFLPLHHTQNTFCTSVSFNLSKVIQMDPGEAYTEQMIGIRQKSCLKTELVKYFWQVNFHKNVAFIKLKSCPEMCQFR